MFILSLPVVYVDFQEYGDWTISSRQNVYINLNSIVSFRSCHFYNYIKGTADKVLAFDFTSVCLLDGSSLTVELTVNELCDLLNAIKLKESNPS